MTALAIIAPSVTAIVVAVLAFRFALRQDSRRFFREQRSQLYIDILADSHASEGTEALLSFWGEPFMAEASERQAPRFIFHVQKNSELLPHLVELDRCYRRSAVTGE